MATQESKKVTEVKAFARHIHVSPRKLRLVANLIRGTAVDAALEQLRFSSKNASVPLSKAINSAVANAVHNFNLNKEDLFVKAVTIDQGPVFKTYAPRAQGRAFVERKRTSHINVILEPRQRNKSKTRSIFSVRPRTAVNDKDEKETEHGSQIVEPKSGEVNQATNRPTQAPRSAEKRKGSLINLKRRLFNRKSGG